MRTRIPAVFNAYGPTMNGNAQRLQPHNQWAGAAAQSVGDFVDSTTGPVRGVLIHLDEYQNGMDERVDGIRVIHDLKSVLVAVQHRGGSVCALHIGNNQAVSPALAQELNAFELNRVEVNAQGQRHMRGLDAAFQQFVTA
ncbi:MAG: hypothetical protein ACK5TN_08915 [Acidobacteriota bacterium]